VVRFFGTGQYQTIPWSSKPFKSKLVLLELGTSVHPAKTGENPDSYYVKLD